MPSFGAISELPISALPVASSGGGITGTGTTSQAQTASGTAQLGHQGTGATSQAQTSAGTGQIGHAGTGATSQAQTAAGSGTVTPATGITGTGATSQAQTGSGAGEISGGFTDTHDGYWTKQWLSKRKKPKIAEVIEFVKEQPQEAIAEVAQEVKKVYPQIDYREVANNVRLQKFIAEQLLQALKNRQDDEDMMDFMMML